MHYRLIVTAGVTALLVSGCSLKKMAMDQVSVFLSESGATFSSDSDPELVRDAIPFGLKIMETLVAQEPRNQKMLLALASNFTQYAYFALQDEAEEIEPNNLERAKELRRRARNLYLRGNDYGLRGLEVEHPGFRAALMKNPKAALSKVTRKDVPLLYWAGGSWAAAISLDKSNAKLMADLPTAIAPVERALELDESWDYGALHEFFIQYDARPAAMGGSIERARKHFAQALELSNGLRASPYVALAENVCVSEQKRDEFLKTLDEALKVDPDAIPEWRLENLVAQRKARRLKARVGDIFP